MAKNGPNLTVKYDLIQSLTSRGAWERADLPPAVAGEIAQFLDRDDTLGVLISGSEDPVVAHGHQDIIAGFDWIKHEQKPKPREPEINVYHYVVGIPDDNNECPVYGPYKSGAHLKHHLSLNEMPRLILGEESRVDPDAE
jgi:hypothetical protein